MPCLSILAEPPVTVVDKVVDKRGTRKVAEAYLQYLYSPEGQEIAGKNFYRPRDPTVAAKYAKQFVDVKLFTIDEVFGGWDKAQKAHFDDGGVFDQIYVPGEHRAKRSYSRLRQLCRPANMQCRSSWFRADEAVPELLLKYCAADHRNSVARAFTLLARGA